MKSSDHGVRHRSVALPKTSQGQQEDRDGGERVQSDAAAAVSGGKKSSESRKRARSSQAPSRDSGVSARGDADADPNSEFADIGARTVEEPAALDEDAGSSMGSLGDVDASASAGSAGMDAAAAPTGGFAGVPPVAGTSGAAGSTEPAGPSSPACPSPVLPDTIAQQRAACVFGAGAMPNETLDITPEQRAAIPVRHVIVMMKENRSYDHYFGQLHVQGQPDSEPVSPSFFNLDRNEQQVFPTHLTTTCLREDPGHQWRDMHEQVNDGAMDGFISSAARSTRSDGHFAMGYYDGSDIPFYYYLTNTYALADRYFASVRSGTAPNRLYLLLGTSGGVRESNAGYPSSELPSVFSRLDAQGVSWAVYSDTLPFERALNWRRDHVGLYPVAELKRSLADGSLPSVSYVDSEEDVEDEHPTADVQFGEAWSRDIYEAVVASPLWPSIALIWTYDEAGGFFDHVPPPDACVAAPSEAEFNQLGARVATVVISPWARPHHVSHVVREHTSILRFIETVFDLPALSARDANSDALLDMFDFQCPSLMTPPPAPPAGTGGCR